MKHRFIQLNSMIAVALLTALLPLASQAQEEVKSEADVKAAFKKDSTGTNPLNFTYDARIYNEYQWLSTAEDGAQNITTMEFRAPLGDGKWQFRGKIRGQSLDINNGVDESGFGDTDLRFMTVPYINMKKRIGVAPGVEFMLPTATDPSLGSGAWTVAPFVFLGYFNPIGKGSIFVPGYQHFISLDEDPGRNKVNRGLIDMFLVKTFANNQYWAYVDPQIILDYENNKEFMQLELQGGMMLDKLFGSKGHSVWVMPSFGIGSDSPYDYSLEVGYKYVWR
ncbi:MAG: hypothetical protein JRK53_27730 [Deltaproteobacteria bacterium]|jgi:hypothetical protein|nr:hypothetical protein [Deltaproteobacteria bacterium]